MEYEKIFIEEAEAVNFANHVGGKMIVRYDYDFLFGLAKKFVVEYKE